MARASAQRSFIAITAESQTPHLKNRKTNRHFSKDYCGVQHPKKKHIKSPQNGRRGTAECLWATSPCITWNMFLFLIFYVYLYYNEQNIITQNPHPLYPLWIYRVKNGRRAKAHRWSLLYFHSTVFWHGGNIPRCETEDAGRQALARCMSIRVFYSY